MANGIQEIIKTAQSPVVIFKPSIPENIADITWPEIIEHSEKAKKSPEKYMSLLGSYKEVPMKGFTWNTCRYYDSTLYAVLVDIAPEISVSDIGFAFILCYDFNGMDTVTYRTIGPSLPWLDSSCNEDNLYYKDTYFYKVFLKKNSVFLNAIKEGDEGNGISQLLDNLKDFNFKAVSKSQVRSTSSTSDYYVDITTVSNYSAPMAVLSFFDFVDPNGTTHFGNEYAYKYSQLLASSLLKDCGVGYMPNFLKSLKKAYDDRLHSLIFNGVNRTKDTISVLKVPNLSSYLYYVNSVNVAHSNENFNLNVYTDMVSLSGISGYLYADPPILFFV